MMAEAFTIGWQDAGWAVDVVCRESAGEERFEECDGVLVYRSPVQRHHGSGLFTCLSI
jgi:hypothetical protein